MLMSKGLDYRFTRDALEARIDKLCAEVEELRAKKDEVGQEFVRAAQLWEEIALPDFQVVGYLDGRRAKWNVPEVLRLAAERVRLMKDGEVC
jgi:hypothetical protein